MVLAGTQVNPLILIFDPGVDMRLTIKGWRWIFIIEGLLTILVAISFKFIVVDWPESATFLTDTERALLLRRLALDVGEARMDILNRRSAKRIFTDWKIYCGVLMVCILSILSSYSFA
jgi:hypothetical protein